MLNGTRGAATVRMLSMFAYSHALPPHYQQNQQRHGGFEID
jgi:hypothetical protein